MNYNYSNSRPVTLATWLHPWWCRRAHFQQPESPKKCLHTCFNIDIYTPDNNNANIGNEGREGDLYLHSFSGAPGHSLRFQKRKMLGWAHGRLIQKCTTRSMSFRSSSISLLSVRNNRSSRVRIMRTRWWRIVGPTCFARPLDLIRTARRGRIRMAFWRTCAIMKYFIMADYESHRNR